MSDDDIRSFFDDEEPEEKKDQPPDDTPEWLRGDDAPGDEPKRPDSLGFTGELQWRKELGDPFSELDDDQQEESFDWKSDQPASTEGGQGSGFGLTGQLSWQQGGDSEEALPEPGDDDLLDWMQPEDSSEEAADEDDGWVQPTAAQEERPSAANYDLPPWLMGADNAQDQGMFLDDTGQLSEAWLKTGEQLPETHESDITYDQWMAEKEEAQRPRDIEEEVPDLPINETPAGEAQGTGEIPDWFLGMEKLDTSDAPDWFQDAPETPAAPAPDLMGEFDLEQSIAGNPDWMNAPAEDDLFGEMALEQSIGEPEDAPAEDDLLPEFNLEQSMADWTPEEALPDEPAVEGDEMPDWLSAMQPGATGGDELALEEALEDSMTGEMPDWMSAPGDDLLAELDLEQSIAETGERKDWFGEVDISEPDQPEWLQQLGEMSSAETIIPGDANFLAELQGVVDTGSLPDLDAPAFQDIDSLLASMDTGEFDLPKTGELLLDPNPEMEDMFAREIMAEPEPGAMDMSLSPDAPAWLTELGASVGQVSAAAIVRQRKDRPLEDLDTRLQNLHDRGEELAVPELDDAEEQDTLAALLPGVSQVLSPTRFRPGLPGLTGDVVLSDAQRDRVKLLKTLVAAEDEVQRSSSAIDRTYDSPYMEGLLDEDEAPTPVVEEAPAPAPKPRTRRRRINVGRLVISLIVAAGVILPYYVNSLRLGDLPPASFAAGSLQQGAFALVDTLQDGDLVLVAVEYGPTGAGELDSLTDALLRHILTRGARPVLVSGNPVGLLHANNVVDAISSDAAFLGRIGRSQPFAANEDYFVVRYLAGNVIGLRGFGQNPAAYLTTDIRGQATDLTVNGLGDMALLVVIAERAEEIRNWSEQIVPLAGAPVVYATGFSAAPLAEPYVQSQIAGLLVGYRDAYTYNVLLDPSLAPPVVPTTEPTEVTPEIMPTATLIPPTDVQPTEVPAVDATASEEAVAPAEVSPTLEPPTAAPTDAPVEPTATLAPDNTPPPPTLTPVPPTSTPTDLPVIIGVVDAQQTINVRSGPGTENAVVTTLDPGAEVRVLGRNSDGSWINIQLADGTEGWVSAELLDIQEPGASTDKPSILARVLAQDTTPTQEGAPTVEATEEVTVEAPSEVISSVQSAAVSGTPYRNERWYSMTLGIVVIVIVIALGSVVNVLRSLFGRRPR